MLGDAEGPGFSFTTGFWVNASAPELVVFATKDEIAHNVFWEIFREVQAGRGLPERRRTDQVFANLPAYAFPVARQRYADYLGWSRWFYGNDDFPCLQIVWPDRTGRFPWEAGFDAAFAADQPDLTENGWLAELAE